MKLKLEIPASTVSACIQLMELTGERPRISMEDDVSSILIAAVEQQISLGVIQRPTEQQIRDVIEAFAHQEEPTPAATLLNFIPIGDSTLKEVIEEALSPESLKQPHEELLDRLTSASDPSSVVQPVSVNEEPIDDTKPPIDLDALISIPFSDLLDTSPNDVILKSTNEQPDSEQKETFKKCIAAVYSRLSEDEWGTEKAQNHVNALFAEVS